MDRLLGMEVFIRVVDSGSFAEAARTLNLSRAMVSKHIQALEDRLGVRLLNRTTRRLSLTEIGTAYYERAQTVLYDVEEAEQVIGDLHAGARGVLKINAPMSFGIRHLAPAICDFHRDFPQVQVNLTLNDRYVDLIEEGYDVAIRIGRLPDSALIARKLAPCHMVVCAAPSYLEKHENPERPSALTRHNHLLYTLAHRPDEIVFQHADGRIESVAIQGSISANNGDVLLAAAIAGAGIVTLPSFIVGDALACGLLVPILTQYTIPPLTIQAVYPHARYLTTKVRVFIDYLVERFRDIPPWDQWNNANHA
jgi:DNA-binding transcriptional LysR family regulator